ncbi:hypothetical protein [Hymenobacter sp. GOD-10R]|uniref:hypothetical protein n=1 Tax=Hymenobacter sp. GOD-10R TaxID=3093922 RepID=UPI002D779527|nr:hypothetical protein [Hymenobacter sp. GOD-10R]WRQ31145.1 hypothetical protein SD425_12835 [Hymenobacter sp. GOD-10R]
MPTKTYYLDSARTEALTASWRLFFRDFQLNYQGQELGRLSPAELKAGHEFHLPDGRRLLVRLQQKFGAQGLDFQVDDRPLSGTVNDPQTQVTTAFAAIMLVAGLNGALSLGAMLGRVELLEQLGFGWGTLVEALLYAGLGWLGKYRLAGWAFYAALTLLVIDGVLLLGSGQGTAGIVVRIFLGIAIYRGAAGVRQLRQAKTA